LTGVAGYPCLSNRLLASMAVKIGRNSGSAGFCVIPVTESVRR